MPLPATNILCNLVYQVGYLQMKKWLVVALIVMSGVAFTGVLSTYEPVPVPPSVQRTGGDAQRGYEYLTTGDYVKGGIPFNIFKMGMGKSKTNYLERTGKNADISHEYTVPVTAANGESTGSAQLYAMSCSGVRQ